MRRTSAGGGSVLSAVAAWPPPSVSTTSNSSSVIRTRSGPDSTTVREGPVMPAAQPIVTSGISGQPITNDRYVARSERNSRTTSADGSAGLPPQPSSTSVDERRSNVRSKRLNFELRSTGTSYSAELGLNELIPFPSAFVSPSSSGSSPFSLPTPTLTTCQLYENDSTSKRSETSHNFIPAESRRQQYQRPVNSPSAGHVTSLSCVRHRTLSLPSTSFVQSSSAGKSGSENLYPLSVSVDKPEVLLSQGNRRQSAGEATGRAVGTRGNSRQLPVPVRQSPLEFGEIKVKPSGERTERPTVVIKPRTQLVECGSTAKFRVAFEGRPEPAVAWIRKGTELRQSDKYLIYESRGGVHVLEVLNANHDDQDVYECIITNQVGTVSCQAELVVYGTSVQPKAAQGRQPSTSDEVIATRSPLLLSATRRPTEPEMTSQPPTTATVPPAFDRKPKSESVTEGDVVKWVCLVRGTPEVLITWEKDGKEVDTNSDRFKLQKLEPGTWTLVVDPVSSSDAGRYVCVARNQFGEARCTFSLMVSTSYRSMSSYKPSPISSNRNTSSAPVPREEQSPVNRPQNVQQTSTSGGGNLPEARPNSAPSKSPSSLSSASNDPSSSKTQSTSVSIFLSSKSSATTKVQATSSEITSPPDGSVDLELCAETKHAGNAETIVVEKSSEISFASHKAVTSTVNNTSSVFMEGKLFQTGEQTVVLLTSDCSRNENEILGSTSSGVSRNETDEYDVTPTRNDVTSDFAFNTCDHDNEKEADETCDQSELFATSPEVVRTPTISGVTKSVDDDDFVDVKPTLRDSAVDSCEALDELPDDSDDVITDVVGTEASMVDLEDDGNVDENGDEDEGVLQTGTADAPGPPFISDVVPDNVHILRGTTLNLKAIFTAQPLPEAIWFKDNSALVPDERTTMSLEPGVATLTIFNTTPSDTGRFAIELSNEFGTERMFSSVTIEDRPEPPVGQPAVTNVTRTSAVLSWSGCSYDGGCTILGYRIEQLLEAENPQNHGLCSSQEDRKWRVVTDCCEHTSFQVHNLRPNTEYRFRVSSVNKHGYSDPGQPSEIAVTIDRKPSVQIADNDDDDDDVNKSLNFQPPTPLDMLDPLSPESLMAIRAEMPFEHREVVIVPGRKFDDFYTRGEEIGRGKFGNVTKCEDKSKSMTLAAKFIRMKPSQREEFKREITVMNLLRHPKVLLLWDAFESPRELVLVMEYVGGQELLQRIISDDYMLTERECIHFLRQICEGVGYIHSRGVLHLDMKPENILCISQNSNEIKIIDFGLAQVHSKLVKLMAGTAEFIAPEVINFDDFSYATDMWSVGVICYLLLSGFSPFAGETEQETLGNVTAGEYDFDCEEFRIISDDAKDFITKLLVQQPKNRMLAAQCLEHRWLSQDVSYMRAKRLSTSQHKKFMAKRKWQKTGNAVKALIRMTDLQRLAAGGSALTTRSTCGSDKSNSDRKSMFSTHSAPLVTTGTTSGAARRTTGGKNPSRSCVRLSLDAETLMTSQPVNDVEGATNQPSGNDHESGSIKSVTTGNIMTDISAANIIIYPNIV